ncbi:MAG: aminopeptidase N [Nitriliruptoraceae bacterium]
MTNTDHARENLTRQEAVDRRRIVGTVMTHVVLDVTGDLDTFGSTTELVFDLVEEGPTFVDLTAASIVSVQLDGSPLDADAITPTRVMLPSLQAGEHRLRIEARMVYRHEGRGMHRFTDPVDGGSYLHTQFEPFDAHLVYACFDQPDIKTRLSLTVDAPAEWVVVANGAVIDQQDLDGHRLWTFATTPLISPYVTAVVAGPYVGVFDTYTRSDGSSVPLGWYVRASLQPHLDSDELFAITHQGLEFFERVFDQPYPFGKYDQLLVPEFLFGAMENPGCVTFSEHYVFRSKVTDSLHERRAETILHEMAHMWFGDLVTMRWWDDLWLNESFATFMAQLAQVQATRWTNAWVTFLDALKSWAKVQDQLPSTHPVADEMPDVESVHQNFDGITYAKGAAVLRQLVAWVGEEEFLAGCRRYFADHAWDNTELADFLAALERTSGRDLAEWRDEWLLTTGVNELSPRIERAEDGTYASVAIEQRDEAPSWAGLAGLAPHQPRLRSHRLALGLYDYNNDGSLVRRDRIELDVTGPSTEVPELQGQAAAAVLIVNDDDLTYAKVNLDAASREVVLEDLKQFAEPLPRALIWSTAWDMVRDALMPAGEFLDLVVGNVASEDQLGVVERVLARALSAVERYGDPSAATERLARLADHASGHISNQTPGSDQQLAWVKHWASTARADDAHVTAVAALLDGDLDIEGLSVDTDLRWHLLIALARAGAVDHARIQRELDRDPTDLGERHAATATAALPDMATKQQVWDRLITETTLSHTMSRQLWTGFGPVEQAEVLKGFTAQYFTTIPRIWSDRSLEWAIGFTAAMYPHWEASDEVIARTDARLGENPSRPERRVLLEQRDTLIRTMAARRFDRQAR